MLRYRPRFGNRAARIRHCPFVLDPTAVMSQSPSTLQKIFGKLLKRPAPTRLQPPKTDKKNLPFSLEQLSNSLQLRFPELSIPKPRLHWQQCSHLGQLVNLPSNALYGPVQEDKANAWQLLKNLIEEQRINMHAFDLRELYGLNHQTPELLALNSWEDMARSQPCRNIRIISMRDYQRALARATHHEQGAHLLTTRWFGNCYYWARQQDSCDFIACLVYARRRGLPMIMPVQIRRIQVNETAAQQLQQHYHMLALHPHAWADTSFMHYLATYKIPYARLPLTQANDGLDALLLPRDSALADAFGQGLRAAGAPDLCQFLLDLNQASPQP